MVFKLIIAAVILCALLYYGYVALAMFGVIKPEGGRFTEWSALIPFAALFAAGGKSGGGAEDGNGRTDDTGGRTEDRAGKTVDDTTASVPKRSTRRRKRGAAPDPE